MSSSNSNRPSSQRYSSFSDSASTSASSEEKPNNGSAVTATSAHPTTTRTGTRPGTRTRTSSTYSNSAKSVSKLGPPRWRNGTSTPTTSSSLSTATTSTTVSSSGIIGGGRGEGSSGSSSSNSSPSSSTTTSVSRIFAQPQLGSRLRSAVEGLPVGVVSELRAGSSVISTSEDSSANTSIKESTITEEGSMGMFGKREEREEGRMMSRASGSGDSRLMHTRSGDFHLQTSGDTRTQLGMNGHSSNAPRISTTVEPHGPVLPPDQPVVDLPAVQSATTPLGIERIVSDESKDTATTPRQVIKALDTTQTFSESPKAMSDAPLPPTTQPEVQAPEVLTTNSSPAAPPTPDSAQPVVLVTPAAQTTSANTGSSESMSKDKPGVVLPTVEKAKTKIKEEGAARRGSWFGSWSRRKGKDVKESQDVKQNKDDQETPAPPQQAHVEIEQGTILADGSEGVREVIDLTGDVFSATVVGSSSGDSGPSSSNNRRCLENRAMPSTESGSQQHSAQSIPFPTSEPESPKGNMDNGTPQSSSHPPSLTSSKTPTITASSLSQPLTTNAEKSKPSSGSSWFRSRPSSKEKGKEKDMEHPAGDSFSQTRALNSDPSVNLGLGDAVSAPTIATNSTTVTTMNADSTTTTNTSTNPVMNPAASSSATATMSPPVPVPLPSSPTDATSNHASASISSVDSEVPPPHVPGSPVVYSAVDSPLLNVEPRERKLSVSSLNPSSSRFVLRIPLLGRPKVPLEQVVGVVGAKEKERQMEGGGKGEGTEKEEVKVGSGDSVPREESTASETSHSPNLSDPQTPPPSAAEAALSAAQTSEGEMKAELGAPSVPTNELSQVATDSRALDSGVNYSWWGYLGWGGGGSSSAPSQQQSSDQDSKENITSEHPNSSTIITSTSTSTPTVVVSQAQVQGRAEGARQGQGDAQQQAKEDKSDITVTSGSELESQGESRGARQSQSRSTADGDGRVGNGEEVNLDSNSRSKETPGYEREGGVIPAESTSTANKRGGEGEGKPPSIFSAETSKSQGSSAAVWYYPWAWYSPTLPAPSADANANKGEGEDQTTEGKKTESEMVKEEALARDDPFASSAAISGSAQPQEHKQQKEDQNQGQAQVEGGGAEGQNDTGRVTIQETLNAAGAANPIEMSISTNKTGWASFFMSRALLTKMITDGSEKEREKEDVERDENGVEVMNIDEDEDGDNEVRLVVSSGTPPHPRRSSAGSSAGKELVLRPSQLQPSSSASPPKTPSSPMSSLKRPDREPKKSDPPAPPLTNSDPIKRETVKGKGSGGGTMGNGTDGRAPSPAPSKKSGYASPTPSQNQKVQTPNLVLPTWSDTFHAPPRSIVPLPPPPKAGPSTVREKISGAVRFVGSMLFAQAQETKDESKEQAESTRMRYPARRSSSLGHAGGKGKEREGGAEVADELLMFGKELPKALDVLGEGMDATVLNGECKVVVIGVAGWSPGAVTRTIAGGFPSPSSKFVSMTYQALERFEDEHEFKFKKITSIALEGDGTIERKVARVHAHLLGNQEWMDDLHAADVIFVATHSQGSIIATHLLAKLIQEGHILTPRNIDILTSAAAGIVPGGVVGAPIPTPASSSRTQRICCLALCGIHLGPLRYLKTSSLLGQYIQYFENAAARELFEFQNTDSQLSKDYVKALRTVMDHGAKMVYVASLNDQVVPIYSGLFTAASHPRILRALYIDGDAYHSSDFLANLLVLLIRILNSGLSDSGLLGHLSEATAGTLSGVGHSSAYEELDTFSLAVKYAFQVNEGVDVRTDLVLEPFNAVNEQNDYEIPWSLRDLIADDRVAHFFADEFAQLRDGFEDWAPKTSILRDVKRKLQPIQRLTSIKGKGKSYSRL